MTEPHIDEDRDNAAAAAGSDDVTEPPVDDSDGSNDGDAAARSGHATAEADDTDAETDAVTDPRVRDAVRRLNELSDLPPAEHVEVYEAVHSSMQELLAEASRQADESPADGIAPS